MAEFLDLMTPEKFFQLLKDSHPLRPVKQEMLAFIDSLHRIVAEDLFSSVDLPPFTRSTVDGFAVRAADTTGVSETLPAYLDLIGEVFIGEATQLEIKSGQAVQIPTGGMLPVGADAVLMLEYTEYLDQQTIEFFRPVAQGENVVFQGEDLPKGELLFAKGHRIRPQDIGALAGLGLTELSVYAKPEVAILSTGDELVAPTVTPKIGQIRDINRYTLSASLEQMGCHVRDLGIVDDSADRLQTVLEKNLHADLILLSGGSSVGVKDLTVDVLNSLGDPGVIIHGVSIKPGKPTILAVVTNKLIIGLPGHPASAWTIFHVLVKPIIRVLKGEIPADQLNNLEKELSPDWIEAVLSRNLVSDRGKEQYIPVKLKVDGRGGYLAEPILGKSSLLTTLVHADGLIKIDTFLEGLNQGELVHVQLFK